MSSNERILSFAVGNDQLALILLVHRMVVHCESWRRVKAHPTMARSVLRTAIASYEPTILACERPYGLCRKQGVNLKLLQTLVQAIMDEPIPHHLLNRQQPYRNRYEEAEALTERFPEMARWCPKQPHYPDTAPRSLVYFEALAYAVEVLDGTGGGRKGG